MCFVLGNFQGCFDNLSSFLGVYFVPFLAISRAVSIYLVGVFFVCVCFRVFFVCVFPGLFCSVLSNLQGCFDILSSYIGFVQRPFSL